MASRKDYESMAEAFKRGYQMRREATLQNPSDDVLAGHLCGYTDAILMSANVFQAENPRFDRTRYLSACGFQM